MARNAELDASAIPRHLRWPATALTATFAALALLALLAWALNRELPRARAERDLPIAAAAARGVLIEAVPPR
ncbi:hypothetical protein AB3X93_25375, partial [Paraburkholderia sp. BR14262]|uniref:hypothetical protein n=1 Tax=Paraburkholderia sp. BR14262 TaxID=3236999 RepID=UPI0034CD1E78